MHSRKNSNTRDETKQKKIVQKCLLFISDSVFMVYFKPCKKTEPICRHIPLTLRNNVLTVYIDSLYTLQFYNKNVFLITFWELKFATITL